MSQNAQLMQRGEAAVPRGVAHATPVFAARAVNAEVWDADGKRYIDYIGSWGPMILGHGHPDVVRAVQEAAARGLSYGAPTEAEVEMAEELLKLVPSMEQLRLVSSGTEAAMSAIRLARGAAGGGKGRRKIIKFEGCYHGHADSLLVKAGSGLLAFGNPSSAGVPAEITQHTLVLDYNDAQQLEEAFGQHGDDIACVIVEPVAGNMNLVRATPEFLNAMRTLCTRHGAILIFDEVMSGFRVALGGAQSIYGIDPDMTVLGKVIGGGMPVAAFGGKREVMKHLAPLGPVYQAGTLSGNPVAVACGMATLKLIQQPDFYERLGRRTAQLVQGLRQVGREAAPNIPFAGDSVGGMFGIYFASRAPTSFAEVMQGDKERFNRFFHAMLDRGVYLAPSAFEAGFVSMAHDETVIEATLGAARDAFRTIAAA